MIDKERIASFVESFEPELPEYLARLEEEALRDGVPIVRKETRSLLRFMVMSQRPSRILELGTATGFSALLMWEAGGRSVHIDTIEKYEKRIPVAAQNLERNAGKDITLLAGDALEILPGLQESYDMIFMDAAKGQYGAFLPEVLRLLRPGGMLITDNVLQDGDILESRYAVRRRDRTIHARMRDYLYELTHREDLQSVILQIGDGVALSVALESKKEMG